MANDLTAVIPQILAQGLMALRKATVMPSLINANYGRDAASKGSTIDVPIPASIAARAVAPASVPVASPDITPTSVSIALNKWYEAPFHLTDKDMMDAFEGTIPMQVSSAVKSLAEQVNSDIMALYADIYGFTGTPGTTPFASTTAAATAARKLLNNQLAPLDPRYFVVDPDAEANALGLSAFSDASFSGDASAIRDGQINRKLGFMFAMDQQVPSHTNGTLTDGTAHRALVNGAPTLGDKTADFDATSLSGTVTAGSVFSVAGDDQTYVVTAAATASGNAITLAFEPGVQVVWADNAQMTLKGTASETYANNLAFHRDAFAIASRPLADSANGLGSIIQSAVDPVSGLSLRLEVSRQHKQTNWSFDILYGVKTIRRELAARVAG